MKLFLDTADTSVIKEQFKLGLIDGVTTNPTLIMKSGRNPEEVYQELLDFGIPDLSMEVVGDGEAMLKEGRRLSQKFGAAATIKLPCTVDGLAVCKALSDEQVKTNVTLIFSAAQALLAAKAGATYVSPFVGRVDDQSFDGIKLIKEISSIFVLGASNTQILAASVRTVRQVTDSFLAGADLVTLPPAVLGKMYNHILTDAGLAQFEKDWASVPQNQ